MRDVEVAAARALLDVPAKDWRPGPGAAPLGSRRTWRPGAPSASSRCVALTQFPLALVPLVWVAAGAGALLARLAPVLLGPTPAERIAILAERNRVARELHDSVGHALGVVSIQAAAAERVLDRDPAFAREALRHIAASARDGQRDLDHVLGLLREEPSAPAPDLGDLDGCSTRTRSSSAATCTACPAPCHARRTGSSRRASRTRPARRGRAGGAAGRDRATASSSS